MKQKIIKIARKVIKILKIFLFLYDKENKGGDK
jgi:hypothetical protein